MSAPSPPVELRDHCSIIHDNVLYVYSSEAFLTLPLTDGAEWNKEENGVPVTGATCVKGGIDGDNSKPALYVVGGVDGNADYSGIQRYSIQEKSWQTIEPVVRVTKHRQWHGTAYMNVSSSILVYAGSQDGVDGLSSETFVLEMFPPYRTLAYTSTAPPTNRPSMFSWGEDRALMVGGSPYNSNIFTFHPDSGWSDLGLALPSPLPDPNVAQAALLTLDDGSRILQTFKMNEIPVSVATNVLLNPGGQPAYYGETVGGAVTTASPTIAPTAAPFSKRNTFLNNYPTYNESAGPDTTRTGFNIAQGGNGLLAFVGGDADSSVAFFNQTGNGWVQPQQVLGDQPSTTASTTASPTGPSATASTTSTPSAPPTSPRTNKSRDLTILGGVLGGLCGLAAIIIVLLLWLRSVRKRKQRAARNTRDNEFPNDKRSLDYEHPGSQPLSRKGQPMGRSPIASAVMVDTTADSTGAYGARPQDRPLVRRVSGESNRLKLDPQIGSGHGFGRDLFKRDKSPLTISKPMLPDLGDYKDRPSIELGKATPAVPVAAAMTPGRNKSQRKTDEGWAKYFAGDKNDPTAPYKADPGMPPPSRGKGAFWPGSGAVEPPLKSPKRPLRDTAANTAPHSSTGAVGGRAGHRRGPSTAQHSLISRADSRNADMSPEEEEEHFDAAFSNGIPSTHETAWTPVGNTWSGPSQRPLRPPSTTISGSDYPYASSSSGHLSDSSANKVSIPNFPMPSTIRPVRPSGGGNTLSTISGISGISGISATSSISESPAPATHSYIGSGWKPAAPQRQQVRDYSAPGPGRDGSLVNDDMSWLNLGTTSRNANNR